MNKTVTVNIGGIVFHIDDNAYERFKQYLDAIRMHFTVADGRDEIMQDIESRIAEMFQERLRDARQVITIEDVDEVTTQMGRPDQFADVAGETAEEVSSQVKIKKRLYRNPDSKFLGGVCGGIAAYFDIDPVWVRIAFIAALFAGFGFLLYIVLWIIIPEAKTTAEKLQMRGEPVTVTNIEKNVREEMAQVKQQLQGKDNVLTRIFEAIGQVIKFLFIFIGKIIAVFFLFIGAVVVFAIFMSILAFMGIPGTQYPEELNQILPEGFGFALAIFGAILVVGIPFLMLAYLGAKILFNVTIKSRIFGMTAAGLWIVGLLICIFMGANIAKDFAKSDSVHKEIPVIQPSGGKLILESNRKGTVEERNYGFDDDDWNGDLRVTLAGDLLESKDVQLDIRKSPTDSFSLVQINYAKGASRKEAEDHASRIIYSFSQSDSVLKLDEQFALEKNAKYRLQKVQLVLRIPVGGKIFMDESIYRLIYDIQNVEDILDRDMLNRTWVMTEKGLSCVDCDGTERTIGGRHYRHDDINIDINDDETNIRIDERGVHITGPDEDLVRIDSGGIRIRAR